MALPTRTPKSASWQREIPTATITIASAATDADAQGAGRVPLPAGKYLRLILIHLFTTAIETKSPVVELGESASVLARTMLLDIGNKELTVFAEQCARLAATKITVSLNGGPALSVFDARGRSRSGSADWRSAMRLNSRFFEQLALNPVELDRSILAAVADNVMAMDAYAWIAAELPQLGPTGAPVTRAELRQRFGDGAVKADEHRALFEAALQQVSAAWPSVRLIIGEEGVELRRSVREAPAQPPRQPAAPPELPPRPPRREAQARPAPQLEMPLRADPRPDPMAAPQPAPPAAPPPGPLVESAPQLATPVAEFDTTPRRDRDDRIAVKSHLTGLHQVVWLQRDGNGDEVLVEVTPGGRYDPQNLTVLALEPIIVQINGGLYTRDFDRVAAWVNANRDLIDDVWYDDVDSDDEVLRRVKKVPPPGWR
jgi:hypothetical protein